MAETHDLGPFFAHSIQVKKGTPLVHRAVTREIDEPFRMARPFVVRCGRNRALVVGRWKDSGLSDEIEALLAATRIEGLDGAGDRGWSVKTDETGEVLERV